MKKWRVLVEVNMDASNVRAIDVEANTAKKAEKFASEKLKKEGAFEVFVIKTMLVEADKKKKGEKIKTKKPVAD